MPWLFIFFRENNGYLLILNFLRQLPMKTMEDSNRLKTLDQRSIICFERQFLRSIIYRENEAGYLFLLIFKFDFFL